MKHKHLILGFLIILIGCNSNGNKSLNNATNDTIVRKPIPVNSIYEIGDKVYLLDSLTICDKNYNEQNTIRVDGLVIYRSKKHEVIYDIGIGKGAITDFILNGAPKDTANIQEFIFDMQGEKKNYREMVIKKNIIVWYFNFYGIKNYYLSHFSSIDYY